jgi:hypothetical protein
VARREQVEYVGGPWDGTSGHMDNLPDEMTRPDGRYVRSVRCADDGAMRYLWRPAVGDGPRPEDQEGETTCRAGS